MDHGDTKPRGSNKDATKDSNLRCEIGMICCHWLLDNLAKVWPSLK